MKSLALAGLAFAALFCFAVPRDAAAFDARDRAHSAAKPGDVSAQARRKRPRTRVYISPPPQPRAWDYPRPGDVSWPGPGAVRDCVARLEPDYRPSGTVIVPRTYCRWVRG